MRIAVLGAGGMLGTDLVRVLRGTHEVFHATRRECDITRLDQVLYYLETLKPDVVINAAAYTKVDACESEQDTAYLVNAIGARNVAVAARRQKCAVVQISTDYIFDGEKGIPYDEFDNPNPMSVYGRSKLAGESLVRSLCEKHYIVRTQWLYGEKGNNFVFTMLRLAREGKELRVVNDQFGSPTYTSDLARAIGRLIEEPRYGTYHLTNSGFCSWYDFTRDILNLSSMDNPVTPISSGEINRPARRPKFSVLDNFCWRIEGLPPLRHYREALADFLHTITTED